MKIVHIITSLETGGAEEMLRRLLKTTNSEERKNTLIITLTGEVNTQEELTLSGYEVFPLKISGILSLFSGILKLYIKLLTFKPQILQTWLYHSDLIGGIVGRLAFAPTVIWNIRCEALSSERTSSRSMLVFKLCKILSYLIPTKIICVGEKAKKTHIQAGFCQAKMTVIFNGYEASKFAFSDVNREKIRQELHIAENELLVGCVGRYHSDKGQDTLIAAAIELLQTNENVKFIFIGRECTYKNPEISKFNINLALRDKILMLGEKKNIAEILSSIDLYCMPSRTEGFPNSLAEAMLTEIPCIATNVGDTATLSGGTLTLIEPDRVDVIVAEIKRYAGLEKQERIIIGRKARQQVINNFTIEKTRENFNALYQALSKHEQRNG